MIVNTYVLTYFLLSFLSLAIGVVALVVGFSVARRWNSGQSSEEQYQHEKKVYLSITLVMLGFWMRLALAPLWFFMLESFVPSIPGAMCLCGVHLARTPYSFISTALKFLAPMAYGYWLVLNSLDRKIETQPLVKRKLYTLIPLSLLMFAESFSDLTFLFSLEPRIVGCCSSLFDDPSQRFLQTMTYDGWGWVVAYYATTALLLVLLSVLLRKPGSPLAAILYGSAPLAAVCFILAVHTKLSPLFLRARFHHCVFCVWKKLPDMTAATAAVFIGCWAALIYAATRSVRDLPGAAAISDSNSRVLIRWAIGALLVGCGVLAVRLAAEAVNALCQN